MRPPLRARPVPVDPAVGLSSVDPTADRRVLQPHDAPSVTADPADSSGAPWSGSQAAAVACAEAIAAEAAADVVAKAAVTARAAVDAASAASLRATARAEKVAARALLAAAAAAREMPVPRPLTGERDVERAASAAAATAAARVSGRVAAVAAAAATAAVKAQSLIREQLVKDESALAVQLLRDVGVETPGAAAAVVADPLAVAEELRYGIGADQLRLHYQPIMSLVSGQPVGVEALVRWQHPERGLLAPVHFLDLAEDTDLISALGGWVLNEACRMAVSLQGRSGTPLTVAVNLSGRQLSDRGLVATVQAALDAQGCGADRLVFEVTETALVTDMAAAADSLRELQRLGAGVALDDFGTGYAPLLYLKQLGADDLKIDRSFVSGLGKDDYDTAIVASLISLAHHLNIRCVAEGVETLAQLELLQQLGCDFAQGYLFCRPTDAASLQVWLDRRIPAELPAVSPAGGVGFATEQVVTMDKNSGLAGFRHALLLEPESLVPDTSPVRGFDGNSSKSSLCTALPRLAHRTEAGLVAEGVLETSAEGLAVGRLRADSAQGGFPGGPGGLETLRAALGKRSNVLEPHADIGQADASLEAAAVAAAMLTVGASTATTADALNARGLTAPSGRRWHSTSVKRLLAG
jgi:EAL domain-containing protein (putative c-di-GMP-specific phosphodiesterase class I)